ncbi:high affinity copper uptake protein 1-like [Ptychodera flava]|uniref:high affinity copper uptake protein 1-like n=1 Tax=Ptychodera flava TaxID=63121 RepID=UPI00396A05C0
MATPYAVYFVCACLLLVGSTNAQTTDQPNVTTTEQHHTSTGHHHMPTGHHQHPTTGHHHMPTGHHHHPTTEHHHMPTGHHHHPTTGHHHMPTGHHHHPTTEHNHDHGGDDSSGHMMAMYFTTGLNFYVLFSDWFVSSTEALIGSCVGIGICAVLYEGLKELRQYLVRRNRRYIPPARTSDVGNMKVVESVTMDQSESCLASMFSCYHIMQTFLHLIQVTISYALMLVAMTYNVWMFLSVVSGLVVGHFLFAWKRSTNVDINEHCQ